MLNSVHLMGRITAPLELKITQTGLSVLSFSIAVERNIKGQNGEKQTDFINIVAWRQTAEFVANYFDKGSMICIEGSIQTRQYTAQDGSKRSVTEVLAERVHFTGESKKAATGQNNAVHSDFSNQSNMQEVEENDDLPF